MITKGLQLPLCTGTCLETTKYMRHGLGSDAACMHARRLPRMPHCVVWMATYFEGRWPNLPLGYKSSEAYHLGLQSTRLQAWALQASFQMSHL